MDIKHNIISVRSAVFLIRFQALPAILKAERESGQARGVWILVKHLTIKENIQHLLNENFIKYGQK
jgi:hypothetical protein